MELTFQVPKQYCSSQHWTLLPSPVISPAGIVFAWLCLFILSGVISPFFSSSMLDTYQPGEFIFQCHIFLPFYTVHGVLKARILKWPYKRLTQTCLWVSRSLWWRHGSAVTRCRVRSTECSRVSTGPFEGGRLIFIISTIVGSQVKQQGGNTALPIYRKFDERFTEDGSAHQNKIQFPPQSVSPIRKLP